MHIHENRAILPGGREGSCALDLGAFLKRVEHCRIDAGISSDAGLAKKAGVNPNTLSAYGKRARKRFPTADDAVLIARALGTTVEYLVTGEHPPVEHPSPEIADICKLVSGLPTEDAREVRAIVRSYVDRYVDGARERMVQDA